MTRILVTGANGQLGNELKVLAPDFHSFQFTFTDVDDLDITNPEELDGFLAKQSFDFVVNCAAYTAVDKAEEETDLAFKINAEAVKYLAQATSKHNANLIHISTDFVFRGDQAVPYKEDDAVGPINQYGKSKLLGEEECLQYNDKSIIIRTSWLYSSFGNNFVKTMQKLGAERDELKVVYDQVGSPTYANDLAEAILKMLAEFEKNPVFGIFHYSNEGVCSWYDFAVAIMELSNIDCRIKPIETFEYPTPAQRGAYTVLNKRKIKKSFNIEIPHWRDSLQRCISKLS